MSAALDEFIDRQVSFQLGRPSAGRFQVPLAEVERLALRPSNLFAVWSASGNALRYDTGAAAALQDAHWKPNPKVPKSVRLSSVITEVRPLAQQALYAFDMQDARFGFWRSRTEQAVSVFQYNRRAGDEDAVLWPLVGYHDLHAPAFMGFKPAAEPPFEKKRAKVFWRGALSGTTLVKKQAINTLAVFNDFVAGHRSEAETLTRLQAFSRFRVTQQACAPSAIDAKIVLGRGQLSLDQIDFLRPLLSEKVSQEAHLQYKYLLCLQGYDIASSLYWMMNSQSVVFKEQYEWEIFCDCHFKPWEHYVPVQAEAQDILEKFDWCERHPAEAQRISENARSMCAMLARAEVRQAALQEVIRRYESNFAV